MKLKNLLNLMVLGSALTITAVGCKTHPQGLTPLPGHANAIRDPNSNNNNPEPAPPFRTDNNQISNFNNPNPPGIPPTSALDNWAVDPSMPLKAETIYFDYDKSAVKKSEQSKLEEVASYMKSHGEVGLRVEGNCDSRGTEEYNRALGERRALGAREYLVNLGISADRIATISYGEDKPVDPAHSEAAYAKNRRDDFSVLLPPKP